MALFSLILYAAGLVLSLGAAGAAVFYDARGFRLPNFLSLIVLGAAALAFIGISLHPDGPVPSFAPVSHGMSAGLVFIVTLFLFGARMIGAGDAKFLSALSIWFPLSLLPQFIFMMSLMGGVIAVLTLIMQRLKPFRSPPAGSWMERAQAGDTRIPYGIAIGIAFWAEMTLGGYFNVFKFINL